MFRSFRQSLLVATAMLALSAAALAATPPTAAPPNAVATAPVLQDEDHNLTVRVEQRITDLHTKLQITAAQQPQWDRFTEIMRTNARNMVQGFDARVMALPGMTAPDSLQSYATMAASHAADMQTLVPAFKALYLTMSDDQKRVTDKVFLDEAHGGDVKAAG